MTPYNCDAESNRKFVPPGSDMALEADRALGLVDFTMWVHVDNPDPIFEEHSMANVEKWAAGVPVPTYAIDDATAIKVSCDTVEVVSEGHWRVFDQQPQAPERLALPPPPGAGVADGVRT